jgi:hypothetical protein
MESEKPSPESFDEIIKKTTELMSIVSKKASRDLKDHLPSDDVLGNATSTAGNITGMTESLVQLGTMFGELLIDATARLTSDVAPRLLDPPPVTDPVTPAASPSELVIRAVPGAPSPAVTFCVDNTGTGAAHDMRFSKTALWGFDGSTASIGADSIVCALTPTARLLEGGAWMTATVAVEVPKDTPPGEYFGHLRITEGTGNSESAGDIALRVIVGSPEPGIAPEAGP